VDPASGHEAQGVLDVQAGIGAGGTSRPGNPPVPASRGTGWGGAVRTAWLYAAGDLRLTEEPVPRPEPGGTLVRVTAVGR
jgi:hypothetical protein